MGQHRDQIVPRKDPDQPAAAIYHGKIVLKTSHDMLDRVC